MWSRYKQKYRYSLILTRELVLTEFKLRYQGSVLGYLWSLMRPLFLFIILFFVFVYFLRIGSGVPHWPVQLLLGIVLWNFFAETTSNGISAVVDRSEVIRKINFPKYVIIFSSSISALINLLINLVVIGVFMVFNKVPLQWEALIAPLYILQLFVLGLGIAFLLGSWYVKVRDIKYIWEIVMQGLFYASVVIYPISELINRSDQLAKIVLLNPVAQIIQDTRHNLVSLDTQTLGGLSDNPLIVAVPIVITVMVALAGAIVYQKLSSFCGGCVMSDKQSLAISVEGVKKEFKLPHEKNSSIKSSIVNMFKKSDKGYTRQKALRGGSFEIKQGEFFGILGRNGSGKSTLLKVLAEIYQPSDGLVDIHGKLVPFIELGVGFNPELTGRENVYLNGALLGFSKKEVDSL